MKILVVVLSIVLAEATAAGEWHGRDRRPGRAFGPDTEHVIGGRAVTSDEYRPRRHRHRRREPERIIIIERDRSGASERRWR